MSIKREVKNVLIQYPQARDDDRWLLAAVWSIYYTQYIKELDGKKVVNLSDILSLPSSETIGRIRRKFQEEGLYLATPLVQDVRLEREHFMQQESFKSYKHYLE